MPKEDTGKAVCRPYFRIPAKPSMPFFDDDGSELNPDLIPKPHLCVGCMSDDTTNEMERMLCTLTRLDQQGEDEFICHAFKRKLTVTPSAM